MNILYIIPNQYKRNIRAGGMGTKTDAIAEAWSLGHFIDINDTIDEEVVACYDVILIELLGLRNGDDFEKHIEAFKSVDIPKVVYGSDSELLRWSGKNLAALQEVVTLFIPNMQWQANYFRDFDLPVSDVVYEPINCDLFCANTKEKIIVAGGTVNYEKNCDFFVDLFQHLKEQDTGEYQTHYIGSAGGWDEFKPMDLELEHHLKNSVDVFHGNIKPIKVAQQLGTSAVGVLNPHYETCNRFDMEMMACGIARSCGPHVCYDERPTVARFKDVESCIAALVVLTNNFTELPPKEYNETARQYAEENFSYEASVSQLTEILERII